MRISDWSSDVCSSDLGEGHRPVSGLYMLDTNIVSELARNPQGSVAARIAEVGPDAICVSIITAAELRYGCARKGSARQLAQIEAILDSLQILALDVPEIGREPWREQVCKYVMNTG